MKNNQIHKIAVTGAGGFLGSAAVEFFSLDPQISEIRALYTRPPLGQHSPKVIPVIGELRNELVCHSLVSGVDTILHFAQRGFPGDREKDPARVIAQNLLATDHLLHAMKHLKVKHLVYAGSGGAIYQDSPAHTPFVETDPTVPRTPYAAAKLITEYSIQEFASHFDIKPTLLRISNPFGIGQFGRTRQGFIGVLLGKLLSHEPMKIWSSLDTIKDFIYIDDLLSALDAILKAPQPLTGLFNLGSGHGVSLMEVIQTIEKVTERQVLFELTPNPIPENKWTVLNCSKFTNATGWKCQHRLEDGVEELWDHLVSRFEEAA